MPEYNTVKKQWEKRVSLVKAIYSCLILKPIHFDLLKLTQDFSLDAEQIKVLEYIKTHLQEIVNTYEKKLADNWTFDRLNLVEQAILIEAYAEKKVLNTDKNILIDQAVISTKNYCDEDAYKFVNGILDKVLD